MQTKYEPDETIILAGADDGLEALSW